LERYQILYRVELCHKFRMVYGHYVITILRVNMA